MNGTPQPVSVREVLGYCELFRIDSPAERERLYRMVRRLDAVFLSEYVKKHAAAKPPAKAG